MWESQLGHGLAKFVFSEGCALALDVVEGISIVLEERRQKTKALLMEIVDVLDGVGAEDVLVNQVSAVGAYRQVLPAKEIVMLRMLLDHDDVFDSDSELSILVVAWLI